MLDLFANKLKALFINIKAYNLSLNKNEAFSTKISNEISLSLKNQINLDFNSNEEVNKLFNVAKAASNIISDLANINP